MHTDTINWSMYVSWFAGPLLQVFLLTCMARRGWHRIFPRFFSYILFQSLKSAGLFITYRYFPQQNYFDAYWAGNAVSVFLAVVVMDEILASLLREYGGNPTFGVTIFRWSCGLLLLLAIISGWTSGEVSPGGVLEAVLAFDRSVRLMQCGLFLLLMLLCRYLRDCWRQPAFGMALGFGVFASVELILVSMVMAFGSKGEGTTISLVKSAAYNIVTLLWIGYLRQQAYSAAVSPATRVADSASPLPARESPSQTAFMLMVEDAVDRVLSRSNWPRPSTEGSRIVGRKPNLEESN
jgi:hypothetical protein